MTTPEQPSEQRRVNGRTFAELVAELEQFMPTWQALQAARIEFGLGGDERELPPPPDPEPNGNGRPRR